MKSINRGAKDIINTLKILELVIDRHPFVFYKALTLSKLLYKKFSTRIAIMNDCKIPKISDDTLGLYIKSSYSGLDISMYHNIRYFRVRFIEEQPFMLLWGYKFPDNIRVVAANFNINNIGNLEGDDIKIIVEGKKTEMDDFKKGKRVNARNIIPQKSGFNLSFSSRIDQ